jgi:hypothetical protein
MLELVKVDYEGQSISFSEDGWFNATQAADRFGKRPIDWLRLPETDRYIEALCQRYEVRKSHFVKSRRGGNLSKQGTWFHRKLAIIFARWLNIEFAIWCDEQIDSLLRGNHPHYDWKRSRHSCVSSNKTLNLSIKMTRERLGKTCAPHHFSNEARLINHVMTGTFGKLDRDSLGIGDLDLLSKLEVLNTVLVANNMPYPDRKEELERYAADQRGPRLIESAAEQTSGALGA